MAVRIGGIDVGLDDSKKLSAHARRAELEIAEIKATLDAAGPVGVADVEGNRPHQHPAGSTMLAMTARSKRWQEKPRTGHSGHGRRQHFAPQ